MGEYKWVPPEIGRNNGSIDVSSYGTEPFRKLSPFSHNPSYEIPVPGNEQLRSHSVEGVWQGLKIIDGQTDPSLFVGKPRKLTGNIEGHQFGKDVLGYLDARRRIYLPTYTYHVVNNGIDAVRSLEAHIGNQLYDIESNDDVNDTSRPYSHAALLVDLLNVLGSAPIPPFNKQKFQNLSEQVDATVEYRKQLSEEEMRLFDEVITFAYLFSQNDLGETFALRTMKKGDIDDKGRLERFKPTIKTEEPYMALL